MCDCEIITTEDGRGKIREKANQQPIAQAITPYGLDPKIQTPQKQIVKQKENATKHSISKENNSVHAKLLLTKDYAIIGSSNFTQNSINKEHEFIEVIDRNCHPEKHKKLRQFFEQIWRRSTKINGGK